MLTFIYLIDERLQRRCQLLLTVLLLISLLPSAQAQFSQKQKLVASDRDNYHNFGNSVDISGNCAIIGAYNASTDATNSAFKGSAGAAYIVELQPDGQFSQKQKLVAGDRAPLDHFGRQTVISGNYAAVSAHWNDTDANGANPLPDAGAVYIFERQPNNQWTQVAKLVEPDRAANRAFGSTLALSGDFLIAGSKKNTTDANGNNPLSNAGAAHIFQRQANGQWVPVAKLLPSNRHIGQEFGLSVSLDNNRAVVGSRDYFDAQGNNLLQQAGAVFVFVRQPNGQWQQQAKLVAADRSLGSLFGGSVDIVGNYIGVGAPYNTTDAQNANPLSSAGSAYLFEQINGQWQQVSKVVASDRSANSEFGQSVSLSGSTFLVGAFGTALDAAGGNPLTNAGGAYLFNRQANGSWTQSTKIVANDRGAEHYFGLALTLEGEKVLVGATGNQTDASGNMPKPTAGAAYLFTSQGTTNQPPVVNQPLANQETQFGSNYSFPIPANTFTDPKGQPLTLSAAGLPNGVSLVGTTLSGTPMSLGVHTVTITATNTDGLSASTSFLLDVKNVGNPPQPGSLQLIAPLYNCQTGAFTFQVTGGDGSPIEYMAIGITGWTTSPYQFVDVGLRTANDVKPLTLRARQNGQEVTLTWDLMGVCSGNNPPNPNPNPNPGGGGALQLTAPDYNCQTGAFTFKTQGGNGSTIEYMAIGITSWTTNPNAFVDTQLRTAADVQPLTLRARQDGTESTFTWDIRAQCPLGSGRQAGWSTNERLTQLDVTVLGNPIINEQVEFEVRGIHGQTLRLTLTDLQGHILAQRQVDRAEPLERHRFTVSGRPAGILLLRVSSGTQQQILKLVKP